MSCNTPADSRRDEYEKFAVSAGLYWLCFVATQYELCVCVCVCVCLKVKYEFSSVFGYSFNNDNVGKNK